MTISTPDGAFEAYVATPEGAGPWPAVVVIQEIFGVNDIVRQNADRIAALGFIAVAPDLFWRQEPGVQISDKSEAEWAHAFRLMKGLDFDKAMEDIQATITAVRGDKRCSGLVGAVGHCLGGQLAFLAATRTDADAAVGYYGVAIDKRLDEAGKIKAPLLLHIANDDEYTPPDLQAKIIATLKDIPGVEIETYLDCGHAFAREGGIHYDKFNARLANMRTAAFLVKVLKPETAEA
jgi:carboxymethylenebutenolidase